MNSFSPDEVLPAIAEAAIIFKRDTVDVPSGDECRQLAAKGIRWRHVVCGYLSDGQGGCISAFATTNDIKPEEGWQEKAYRKVIVTLANRFMQLLIERQNKAVVEGSAK